jgi:uncharacterized membrane protein (UPF0127 family)
MIFFKRLLILIGVVVFVVLIGNNTIIKTKVVYKGQEYQVRYLYSESQQSQGLSNINSEEFQVNEIAFFVGKKYENKQFWMPNTYFDLDIFYLDKFCVVTAINRNLPHFKDSQPESQIPRAKPYLAYHVMEMRADSYLAKSINKNDQLNFCSYLR